MNDDKSYGSFKIDRKWVREEKRIFCELPPIPRTGIFGEEDTWLELLAYIRDDLRWLLSLEHHKFWSFVLYSEKLHNFIVSFLSGFPPVFVKDKFLQRDDVRNIFADVERLMFLVFLRLSTEKESEGCYIRNFGDMIYNNYLFTIPMILDICSIYGASNEVLVKKMVNNIITSAPYFLDDIQEVVPHFTEVLKTVKDKFFSALKQSGSDEIEDLCFFLCDSVSSIVAFFEIYPNVCHLFSRNEVVSEIVKFYSNVLPEISSHHPELIENVRIDMMKIVKIIFDYISKEANEISSGGENLFKEYIALVEVLLSEPVFLIDYNVIYPIEFEVGCMVNNCQNVSMKRVNEVLQNVESVVNGNDQDEETGAKLNSLITEVMDIFPHLEESFIKNCLKHYNNNTERVIAAILENHFPPQVKEQTDNKVKEPKPKATNFNDVLNDKEDINKLRERYAQLSIVTDEVYDDEYDDTYDENMDAREEDDLRRPFVIPRVLRTKDDIEDSEDEEEEETEDEEEENKMTRRDQFIENPAVIRERQEQRRMERKPRGGGGGSRGGGNQGQRNDTMKKREYKEFHKSSIANHNRKKQARRKMNQGMIPS